MPRRRNDKTLLDRTPRALQRAGMAWRTTALALAVLLLGAPLAHALVVDGGPLPDQCALTASLSATPSSIDRNASPPNVISTVTWSVTASSCPMLGLYLTGVGAVGLSGQVSGEVLQTATFALNALLLPGQPTLASATVTVYGDPGVITISPGPTLTADDLAQFNAQWM